MECRNGQLVINPRFNKLIIALRTTIEKGDGTLDKEAASHLMTCFDPIKRSLMFWH
jgi:hypothetical protein